MSEREENVLEAAPTHGQVCRMCGGGRRIPLTRGRDNRYGIPGKWAVVRCQRCGLLRTSPCLSETELLGLYERYYTPDVQEGDSLGSATLARLKKGPLYWLWNWWSGCGAFRNLPVRGRVLDVGCLRGDMMLALQARGQAVVGLEPNPKAAAAARARNLQVHQGTLLTTDLPAKSFDTIILSQVLEHMADPLANLGSARRLLRPGGRLVITCPNAGGLLRRILGKHWIGYHLPFHIHHFDRRSLAALLRAGGFRVLRMSTHTPDYWVMLSMQAWVNAAEGQYRLAGRRSHLLTRALTAPLFRLLDMFQLGDALLAVAIVRSRSGCDRAQAVVQ